MKVINRKLLALVIAAAMVIQSGQAVYAADPLTAGEGGAENGQTISEQTSEEEQKTEGAGSGDEQEDQGEEAAQTYHAAPRTVSAKEVVEQSEDSSDDWEVYGQLNVNGAVLSGSVHLYAGQVKLTSGRISSLKQDAGNVQTEDGLVDSLIREGGSLTMKGGQIGSLSQAGGSLTMNGGQIGSLSQAGGNLTMNGGRIDSLALYHGEITLNSGSKIEDIMIGSVDQDQGGVSLTVSAGASVENIHIPEGSGKIRIIVENGGNVGNIIVDGAPTSTRITINEGGAVDTVELKGTPDPYKFVIEAHGTIGDLLLTSGDRSYAPNLKRYKGAQVGIPRGFGWKQKEGYDKPISLYIIVKKDELREIKKDTESFYEVENGGVLTVEGADVTGDIVLLEGGKVLVNDSSTVSSIYCQTGGDLTLNGASTLNELRIGDAGSGSVFIGKDAEVKNLIVKDLPEDFRITKEAGARAEAPEGYEWKDNNDGTYTLAAESETAAGTARIGETVYETLKEAFEAAKDGDEITVLKDSAGDGILVPEGTFTKGLTVDFAGHAYAVTGESALSGEEGPAGFLLAEGNKITLKRGTVTSEKAGILILNRSDLTMVGMRLEMNNKESSQARTLSCRNGNVMIDSCEIAADPEGGLAFDVCRLGAYPSVNVTVAGDSLITGSIGMSADNGGAKDGLGLRLEAGQITGSILPDQGAVNALETDSANAFVIRNTNVEIEAPEGFGWENCDETHEILRSVFTARNKTTGTGYKSLSEALKMAGNGETVLLLKDLEGEEYIAVRAGIELDLNGHWLTGAELLYVTGSLKDSGKPKGGFSAESCFFGKYENAAFPVYDSQSGTYSLYDLGVFSVDKEKFNGRYAFRFSKTGDRQEAVTRILNDSEDGRVKAVVRICWEEKDAGGRIKKITKNIAYSSQYLKELAADPTMVVLTFTLTGTQNIEGPITATPMFITENGGGTAMVEMAGTTFTENVKDETPDGE